MLTFNFKKISIDKGSKILDIGCGEGRHIFGAMQAFESPHLIGMDLDLNALDQCKRSLTLFEELDHVGTKFVHSSVYDLPFKDGEFDLVICSEVLEHLEDYNLALQEIQRVLSPKGYFLASVPSYLPEKICWSLSKDYQNMPGGHLRIFYKSKIISTIKDKGFQLISSERFHALHSPYWWLRCIFWKNQESNPIIQLYKKILERQILKRTPVLNFIEQVFNPVLGKSLSLYFKKF